MFHLDLNAAKYDQVSDLDDMLNRKLSAWEELYGSDPAEKGQALRFAGVIERASMQAGRRVVHSD